jgi:hypothetical protein
MWTIAATLGRNFKTAIDKYLLIVTSVRDAENLRPMSTRPRHEEKRGSRSAIES